MPSCDSYWNFDEIYDNWQTVGRVLLGVQTTVMLIGLIFVYPVNMKSTKPVFLSVCWGLLFLEYFFGCLSSLIFQVINEKDDYERSIFGWQAAGVKFWLVQHVLMMVMHQVLTMEILQAAQEMPLLNRAPEDKAGVEGTRNCQFWTRLAINVFYYMNVFVFYLLNSIGVDNSLPRMIFWYFPQAFSAVLMLVSLCKLKSAITQSGTHQPSTLVFLVCMAVQIVRVFFLCLVFAMVVTEIYEDSLDYCKLFKAEHWMDLFYGIAGLLCTGAFTLISFKMIGDLPAYNEERITKGCMHVVKGFSEAGQPAPVAYNPGAMPQQNVVYQQPAAYTTPGYENENEAMLQGSVNQ